MELESVTFTSGKQQNMEQNVFEVNVILPKEQVAVRPEVDLNVIQPLVQSDARLFVEACLPLTCMTEQSEPKNLSEQHQSGNGLASCCAENITVGDQSIAEDENQSKRESDEYLYTKRDEFTSEIYKVSISNMPRKFGFAELKKKMIQQGLRPVKMKVWKDICFVTFRCEEDREKALKCLDGFKWKGCVLAAASARPAPDPLVAKRKREQGTCCNDNRKKMKDDGLSPSEKLKASVTPLWKMDYIDQLKKKQNEMRGFLKRYHNQLEKNCPDLKEWLQVRRNKYGAIPCELQDIVPAPQVDGYRNKCEFTIGPGLDSNRSVVGFRYGTYAQGIVCVGSPDEVAVIPDIMKAVVKAFQSYISMSKYTCYNPEDHSGYWRQLAVRTSKLGHVMIMIDFHPQNLSQEMIDEEIANIKKFFMEGDGQSCGIYSCYFRAHTEKMTGSASGTPFKLIFGYEHITELLLGMKFQISPTAFFQVNTDAAEVLYTMVSDWCNCSPSTTVLDICCGTGTIGLIMAKKVEKIIGIEMCAEAVKDAQMNAEINGITNVKYQCAKAEDAIKQVTKSVTGSDVVAVVDPPRSGLHSSVIVALRNCPSIRRLVYISCNVNGALNNFIDLVRPPSKRLRGPRFNPVKAVAVDLFPHTTHCELVMVFERE